MLTGPDSHVSARHDPSVVVTQAAYLLFYRRRSDHPLGGSVVSKMLESSASPEADSEMTSGSRETSPPAGEGRRLGDSSHNGLSSAFATGQAHHVGDGGFQAMRSLQMNQEALQKVENLPNYTQATMDSSEAVPPYSETRSENDMDVNDTSSWSASLSPWDALRPGARVSKMAAEVDLGSENGDGSSTKAEDGEMNSPTSLDGRTKEWDDPLEFDPEPTDAMDFSLADRRIRESAPPPDGDEDDEDMIIAPLHAPDPA